MAAAQQRLPMTRERPTCDPHRAGCGSTSYRASPEPPPPNLPVSVSHHLKLKRFVSAASLLHIFTL